MNFLSHLYLAGDSEGLIIGNFIADSVKGSDYRIYNEEIQKGIFLHRAIDSYTDAHPIVEHSKERLRSKYKKYSSVIVDIYYDHFLAKNWENYSQISLSEFSKNIYRIILSNKTLLPFKSARFSEYMLRYNILENYARIEGIEQVLKGMANRARFDSQMDKSIEELQLHFNDFEKEFNLFFPQLQEFVKEKNKF